MNRYSDSRIASMITWTVWGMNGPIRETGVHLVDEENNWKREGAKTLCGMSVGSDSTKGYGGVDCKRCEAKARRLGLEVE